MSKSRTIALSHKITTSKFISFWDNVEWVPIVDKLEKEYSIFESEYSFKINWIKRDPNLRKIENPLMDLTEDSRTKQIRVGSAYSFPETVQLWWNRDDYLNIICKTSRDKVVGALNVKFCVEGRNKPRVWINNCFVHPSHRRMNIAKKMLELLVQIVKQWVSFCKYNEQPFYYLQTTIADFAKYPGWVKLIRDTEAIFSKIGLGVITRY